MNLYYSMSTTKAPWISPFIKSDTKVLGWMIEALEIDPLNSDHWLYGTGLTMFGGRDLTKWDTKHNISIQVMADGIEEMSVQEVVSAVGGSELLVSVGDDNGFTFKSKSDLGTAPKTFWQNPTWSTSSSVGQCCSLPPGTQGLIHVGEDSNF